jgi:acetyl-CoA C-acetyltransferase
MTIRKQACIAGIYQHATRKAVNKTTPQLHAEVAKGALLDAGLSLEVAHMAI